MRVRVRMWMRVRVHHRRHTPMHGWAVGHWQSVIMHAKRSSLELVIVKHVDSISRILWCCEQNRSKASTSAVVTNSHIGPHDGSCLAEQILEVLPLALEWEVSNKHLAAGNKIWVHEWRSPKERATLIGSRSHSEWRGSFLVAMVVHSRSVLPYLDNAVLPLVLIKHGDGVLGFLLSRKDDRSKSSRSVVVSMDNISPNGSTSLFEQVFQILPSRSVGDVAYIHGARRRWLCLFSGPIFCLFKGSIGWLLLFCQCCRLALFPRVCLDSQLLL